MHAWQCRLLAAGCVTVAAVSLVPAAYAQIFPAKPVRIIAASAAGGGVDTISRIVAQKLGEKWAQQVVVHPSLPVKSVKELIALAKSQPGQIYYSSSGNGSPAHLAMELLKLMTVINVVHVPYKGTAPGITDLISGRVSLTFAAILSTMQHVKAGKLRVLAVAGRKRSPAIPEVPTVAEAGVTGYEVDVWYALLAPAATPRPVIAQLSDEVTRILRAPELAERYAGLGLEPVGNPPEQTAAYMNAEIAKWAKVVKAAAISAD